MSHAATMDPTAHVVEPAESPLTPESWGKLGMWIFLAADAMSFGGLLAGYGALRYYSTNWPNPKEHFGLSAAAPDIFKAGEAIVGFDLKAKFPEGVMGDPAPATAETGREMFEHIVERFCAIVDEYHEQ